MDGGSKRALLSDTSDSAAKKARVSSSTFGSLFGAPSPAGPPALGTAFGPAPHSASSAASLPLRTSPLRTSPLRHAPHLSPPPEEEGEAAVTSTVAKPPTARALARSPPPPPPPAAAFGRRDKAPYEEEPESVGESGMEGGATMPVGSSVLEEEGGGALEEGGVLEEEGGGVLEEEGGGALEEEGGALEEEEGDARDEAAPLDEGAPEPISRDSLVGEGDAREGDARFYSKEQELDPEEEADLLTPQPAILTIKPDADEFLSSIQGLVHEVASDIGTMLDTAHQRQVRQGCVEGGARPAMASVRDGTLPAPPHHPATPAHPPQEADAAIVASAAAQSQGVVTANRALLEGLKSAYIAAFGPL